MTGLLLTLAHGPRGCVFLEQKGKQLGCGVHPSKPGVCLGYPFDRSRGGHGAIRRTTEWPRQGRAGKCEAGRFNPAGGEFLIRPATRRDLKSVRPLMPRDPADLRSRNPMITSARSADACGPVGSRCGDRTAMFRDFGRPGVRYP